MPPRRRRRVPPTVVDRTAPDFALESVIDDMRLEHVQCRDFSHSWRPYTARMIQGGQFEQVLRCSRCKTLRNRLLSRTGAILSSSYDYADHYVIKGLGRIVGEEKDHLRLLSVQHILAPDTAED